MTTAALLPVVVEETGNGFVVCVVVEDEVDKEVGDGEMVNVLFTLVVSTLFSVGGLNLLRKI